MQPDCSRKGTEKALPVRRRVETAAMIAAAAYVAWWVTRSHYRYVLANQRHKHQQDMQRLIRAQAAAAALRD